ncbi:MAG TPA: hypothetical protein VJ044_07955 [Candidatus Hodarchaeales archaeon]|nr:hypothetical protein [Candidatus Hodarchaeales archaeon]
MPYYVVIVTLLRGSEYVPMESGPIQAKDKIEALKKFESNLAPNVKVVKATVWVVDYRDNLEE